MKKILILYAAYGGGHLSAAKSIKSYFDKNYQDVETQIVDCVKYVNRVINRVTTGAYKQMAKKAPQAWKYLYYHSVKGPISTISNSSNAIMAKKLLHCFEEFNPDIAISVQPFASQMINYLKKKGKITCPIATVMTDFAPHKQWLIYSEYCDYFFVSNEQMKDRLYNEFKINPDKIHVTGIPISEKFSHDFDKKEIYDEFGLNQNKKTILFFGGGEFGIGKKQTVQVLRALIDYTKDYQIIAISGRNHKMNSTFKDIASQAPDSVKVFEFVDKVPELMSISCLVVTKPGGLTISESLASNLPILIINPIPGQEEENAEFLVQSGAAVWIRKEDSCKNIIDTLLNSPESLEKMAQSAKKLAHIHSTRDICEIL